MGYARLRGFELDAHALAKSRAGNAAGSAGAWDLDRLPAHSPVTAPDAPKPAGPNAPPPESIPESPRLSPNAPGAAWLNVPPPDTGPEPRTGGAGGASHPETAPLPVSGRLEGQVAGSDVEGAVDARMYRAQKERERLEQDRIAAEKASAADRQAPPWPAGPVAAGNPPPLQTSTAAASAESAGQPRKGNNVVGILIVITACVVAAIAAIGFMMNNAHVNAAQTSCLSNEKQLATGVLMYVQDYDERYPLAANWNEGINPYIKNQAIFRCPLESDRSVPSYGMNKDIPEKTEAVVEAPAETFMLIDALPGANRLVSKNDFPFTDRHGETINIAFADGHAKRVAHGSILSTVEHPVTGSSP